MQTCNGSTRKKRIRSVGAAVSAVTLSAGMSLGFGYGISSASSVHNAEVHIGSQGSECYPDFVGSHDGTFVPADNGHNYLTKSGTFEAASTPSFSMTLLNEADCVFTGTAVLYVDGNQVASNVSSTTKTIQVTAAEQPWLAVDNDQDGTDDGDNSADGDQNGDDQSDDNTSNNGDDQSDDQDGTDDGDNSADGDQNGDDQSDDNTSNNGDDQSDDQDGTDDGDNSADGDQNGDDQSDDSHDSTINIGNVDVDVTVTNNVTVTTGDTSVDNSSVTVVHNVTNYNYNGHDNVTVYNEDSNRYYTGYWTHVDGDDVFVYVGQYPEDVSTPQQAQDAQDSGRIVNDPPAASAVTGHNPVDDAFMSPMQWGLAGAGAFVVVIGGLTYVVSRRRSALNESPTNKTDIGA